MGLPGSLANPSLELPVTRLQPPATVRTVHGFERVARLLDASQGERVVVLEAPAGFGKSTHLAAWFAARAAAGGGVSGWLALTPSENDPASFLRSIIAALRSGGAVGLEREELALQVAGADPSEITTWLANDLAACDTGETVLALDDLHLIDDSRCLALLEQLIDQAPANMRFLVASRTQPQLSLGRRRAAGELADIGIADLRLTRDETAAYLSETLGLALETATVDEVWKRTEGWPVALQLSGVWLRRADDPASALRAVTGEHRDLVEYLGEQVMESLDDAMTEFLLRTSVLERFSADLCAAVAEVDDAQATIERAERENLFVIPLDDRREWFRYHHLFGQFLRGQLRRRRDADLSRELHRRAYAWHADHGTVSEAFHHAVLAGDRSTAFDMVQANWVPLFRSGRQAVLQRWISLLITGSNDLAPEIADIAGLAYASEGAPARHVEAWAAVAERTRSMRGDPSRAHGGAALPYDLNADVLYAAFLYRDVPAAINRIERVLADEDSHEVWWVPGSATLAFLRYLNCDDEAAHAAVAAALAHPEARQRPMGYLLAFATQSLLLAASGEVIAGRRSATQAVTYAGHLGLQGTPAAGVAQTALARNLLQTGMTAEATAAAELGYARLRDRMPQSMAVLSLLTIAQTQHLAGDAAASHVSADAAEAILDEFTDASRLSRELAALRASLANDRRRRPARPGSELTETELLALRHLAGGDTVRETAAALNVSPNTIKTHTSHIYRKLGASSRHEAIAAARAQGLL